MTLSIRYPAASLILKNTSLFKSIRSVGVHDDLKGVVLVVVWQLNSKLLFVVARINTLSVSYGKLSAATLTALIIDKFSRVMRPFIDSSLIPA